MADGSLSQFKATLARKKARKEKSQGKFDRKKFGFTNSDAPTECNFPKLSDSELEKVKIDIRTKAKSERRREYVLFVLLLIGVLGLLLYLNG